MEIINELERDSRDVYTGTIGFWGPGRRAQFNVAIRTAWIHKQTGEARYGIGSAIVWDSDAKLEWKGMRHQKRHLKARTLKASILFIGDYTLGPSRRILFIGISSKTPCQIQQLISTIR